MRVPGPVVVGFGVDHYAAVQLLLSMHSPPPRRRINRTPIRLIMASSIFLTQHSTSRELLLESSSIGMEIDGVSLEVGDLLRTAKWKDTEILLGETETIAVPFDGFAAYLIAETTREDDARSVGRIDHLEDSVLAAVVRVD